MPVEEDDIAPSSSFNDIPIHVKMQQDEPRSFTKTLSELKDKANYLSRKKEKGFVNEQTGAAMVVRDNGQTNLASSLGAQYKLNPNGTANEISLESYTTTNRKNFITDEIVVNHHKLNPALYELTDMQNIDLPLGGKGIVGNFTVLGTVLVKAWEPELKRYMLIRRLCRMPMFSNQLNVPLINKGLGITDPLEIDEDILALSKYGYQVNSEIKDAKSLVGKEGVNRGGSGGGSSSGGAGAGTANAAMVEKAVQIAIQNAANAKGYDLGANGPDYYDCTSFVSTAFKEAGFDVPICHGDDYNEAFPAIGFERHDFDGTDMSVLQRGDILNKDHGPAGGHTEIYIGGGQVVGAHCKADGVSVRDYWNDDWEYFWRWPGK